MKTDIRQKHEFGRSQIRSDATAEWRGATSTSGSAALDPNRRYLPEVFRTRLSDDGDTSQIKLILFIYVGHRRDVMTSVF